MKEVLKPVLGKKGPKYVHHNNRVAIEKRYMLLYQIRPLLYDVYDLKTCICLGTCEVWYRKEKDKKILVLKEFKSKVPGFSKILEVANKVLCGK